MHLEDRWVRKDRTRKPDYGTGLRWRVVWHEGPRRRTKSFRNKDAAAAYLTSIDHRQRSGEYVATEDTRRVLADYWPRLQRLKAGGAPKTRQMYANAWSSHLEPRWGQTQVRSVRGAEFAEWLEGVRLSASGRHHVKLTMGALLSLAVDDGLIPRNPVATVRVRPDPPRHHIYLTVPQVRALLEHMPEDYRLFTTTLVQTGIRVGEAVELRAGDVDFDTRRIRVSRAWADGVVTTPKSRRSRLVPIPGALAIELGEHLQGKGAEDLVFTGPKGARIDRRNYMRRHLIPAARAAGLPEALRVHDLRHTFASLAISSGASVKVVQNAMGHADATVTLNTYAGLFDTDLNDVADRMGALLA